MELLKIERALEELRRLKPLIFCLTNEVTMGFVANCLLAIGAAPIMSGDSAEFKELIELSSAIYINIGTLNQIFLEHIEVATELGRRYGKPIVFDPVGAGASEIRTDIGKKSLIFAGIIRGNASEIMALGGGAFSTFGVEACDSVKDAEIAATRMAKDHNVVVVVSGSEDFVTSGAKHCRVTYGSSMMKNVTGMGCALTAAVAAFRAVVPDSFDAARFATTYFGLCGQLCGQNSVGPGSFCVNFIDHLYGSQKLSCLAGVKLSGGC